uniref:Major facilitator superfamily (MFS) profile domain-containing protein n=1 Tax=Panagrolaimus sp. JU765 TaxID=591449 RepID=A0AC34QPN3_9BILA
MAKVTPIFFDDLPPMEGNKNGKEVACGNHWRFVIALQGSLFLASIMGNVIGWNAALLKLMDTTSSPLYNQSMNGTDMAGVNWNDPSLPIADRRIVLSPIQISLLFAVSFIGSGCFVIPATYFMRRFGTYRTMVALMASTVAVTALTPWATVTNFNLLLVIRVIQGMAQSNPYPVITDIINSWASVSERGVFVSLLTGYTQLSAIITTPIAGFLANNYGWPSVFYFQAMFCGTLLVIWAANYRDDPARHPLVGAREVRKISTGKKLSSVSALENQIPVYRILLKPSVWAVYIAGFCFILSSQFNISFYVMYLHWALGHDILSSSIITAVPLIIQYILQFITGLFSDKITSISERTKMRFFCTLSFTGCGIGFISSTFVREQWANTICTMFSFCLLGFSSGGFPKSAVLISQEKPATVMGFMQAALTLGLLTGSFLVPSLTPDRSFDEYSLPFRLYGCLLILANIFFFVFCKAEPEDFAKKIVS